MITDPLTLPLLRKGDMLFVNLVHEDCPDFEEAEKQAIVDYVAEGGALLVLAEHTNVYYHAQRLNTLLDRFGIQIQYTSALDAKQHCIMFPGWIQITHLKNHPTNKKIRSISFQVGGTLDTQFGTGVFSAVFVRSHL
jgi:hypothetical protein